MFNPHVLSKNCPNVVAEVRIASCEVSGIGNKSLTFLACPKTLHCWFVVKCETHSLFRITRIDTLEKAIEFYNSIPI